MDRPLSTCRIRAATAADDDAIWSILAPILAAGEAYALPRDMNRRDALSYWFAPRNRVFVAEEAGTIVGSYYLRANQLGGGSHVANGGYATATAAGGRGIARAMGLHSLAQARDAGFTAMQFNFVIASNTRAVRLWTSLGFETVGRLPGAFRHPQLGPVDALIMYRHLAREEARAPLP